MKIAMTPWTAILAIILSCQEAAACELMAFSFNQDVPARHMVSAFWHHGPKNPDGWGVAFYPDRSAVLFKESQNAANSKLAEFLAGDQSWKAKLLIAHVRKASVGGPAYQNTHPFLRELDGKEYVFAHNGTLKGFNNKVKLSRFRPLGATDSEALFCHLLEKIDRQGIAQWKPQSFRWLQKELQTANGAGTLNCVFSDGTHLFAYHDINGYNGLHYLSRHAPYGQVYFSNLSKHIDLGTVYPVSAVGVMVATKPLTDEKWESFARGQLMVWKDGVQVFPKAPADRKEKEKTSER